MENDNEIIENNPEKAQEYFRQFSGGNIETLKGNAENISEELEVTRKLALVEREVNCKSSEYVLEIEWSGGINMKLLEKVGLAFGFYDPACFSRSFYGISSHYDRIGITSKESFNFFYDQLNKFIESSEKEAGTSFVGNKIVFKNKNCVLPPDTLESEFCEAMYKLGKVGQPVEWYNVSEHIEGIKPPKQESHQTQRPMDLERYHSAMRRINERVKECFDIDELFVYKKRFFTRTK